MVVAGGDKGLGKGVFDLKYKSLEKLNADRRVISKGEVRDAGRCWAMS